MWRKDTLKIMFRFPSFYLEDIVEYLSVGEFSYLIKTFNSILLSKYSN